MILTIRKNTYLFILLVISSTIVSFGQEPESMHYIQTGADQIGSYLPKLKGKKIAIVANQTSVIYDRKKTIHIVDSLASLDLINQQQVTHTTLKLDLVEHLKLYMFKINTICQISLLLTMA